MKEKRKLIKRYNLMLDNIDFNNIGCFSCKRKL